MLSFRLKVTVRSCFRSQQVTIAEFPPFTARLQFSTTLPPFQISIKYNSISDYTGGAYQIKSLQITDNMNSKIMTINPIFLRNILFFAACIRQNRNPAKVAWAESNTDTPAGACTPTLESTIGQIKLKKKKEKILLGKFTDIIKNNSVYPMWQNDHMKWIISSIKTKSTYQDFNCDCLIFNSHCVTPLISFTVLCSHCSGVKSCWCSFCKSVYKHRCFSSLSASLLGNKLT